MNQIPDTGQQPGTPGPPQPAAPPTSPGAYISHRPPAAWPKVIGIISIILAALGAFGVVSNIVTTFAMDTFQGSAFNLPNLDIVRKWKWETLILSLVALPLSILLLVGGIRLLQRNPRSIGLLRVWAWLDILLVIANSVLGYIIAAESMQAMASMFPTSGPGAASSAFAMSMGRIGVIFGAAIGLAWPLFILIWLSRRQVKDEYESWTPSGSAAR